MNLLVWYASHQSAICGIGLGIAVLICVLHYRFFQAKACKPNADSGGLVKRFTRGENFQHWLRLILFITVAITGSIMVMAKPVHSPIGAWHGWIGFILVIISVINLINWRRDVFFHKPDLVWLKSLGGYLAETDKILPAGRFNAGQKVFFWLILIDIIALMITAIYMEQLGHHTETARQIARETMAWGLHSFLGLLGIMMVIGHAYLSLFINPETARVMWDGYVNEQYTRQHHPLWKYSSRRYLREGK
ncbi:MAG: formate dehydrogenase subunit gamma [Methylocystaceae bacterium]